MHMYSKLLSTYRLIRSHQRNHNGGEYGGMNKKSFSHETKLHGEKKGQRTNQMHEHACIAA